MTPGASNTVSEGGQNQTPIRGQYLTPIDNRNALASAASLPGVYRSWLSSGFVGVSPAFRFISASVPYVRVDGVVVANDWDDVVDGSLLAPINVDETGGVTTATKVWTLTAADGEPSAFGAFCSRWRSAAGSAQVGDPQAQAAPGPT